MSLPDRIEGIYPPSERFSFMDKSDKAQILEAIAALADGLRSRDVQLAAISEQIRQAGQMITDCSSADWLQTRMLLDLINKRLQAIESKRSARKKKIKR